MENLSEVDRLLQTEWRDQVIPNIGKKPWIRVYQRDNGKGTLIVDIGSIFVPNVQVSTVLKSFDWGTYVDRTGPSVEFTRDDEKDSIAFKYSRFGNCLGIEPIVLLRSYDGLKPETLEILEEFRLFHNLNFDSANNKYIKHDESGDEIDVVKIDGKSVDVRRKELRQFLTARSMALAVHIERRYFSSLSIDTLSEQERSWELRREEFVCQYGAITWDASLNNMHKSYSWLLAKKIIRGFPPEKSGIWPFDEHEEKQYEEFKIGVNDDDEPIFGTSNPDKLANFFGKNPDAPQYVTPVYFHRKVLEKYYNEPSKYSVEDGYLRCGGMWGIRLGKSELGYVIVLLGDLGRDLPKKEQAHWKHYNVIPDGPISETTHRRWYLGEFADPEDTALVFQQSFQQVQEAWYGKFGWLLFTPLSQPDAHHFDTLHRPLSREPSELDEIAVSLSKLLPEAINSDMLLDRIKAANPASKRSLPKKRFAILKEFLNLSKFRDTEMHIAYLEKVQLLRSASASHRTDNKPDAYKQVTEFFELDTKSTIQVADDIFTALTDFLDSLREHFCPDDTG